MNHRVRPGLIIAAVLACAGCAHYQPRPLAPADSLAQFEQRSLSDEALRRYAETHLHRAQASWPPASWDLETLTLAAFYFNPDLAVARTHYETVAAAKTTAAQRPNPVLSVSPAYNTTTAIPSPWLVPVSLDVPLETAGKRGHRQAQAQHLADAAQFALAGVAWEVRVKLRRALVELWLARESQSLLREQQSAQEFIVTLLEQELAAGGITPTEVAKERMALEQTRLASLDAESRNAQALALLAGAIGLPSRALDGIKLSFDHFNQPPGELPASEARRRALFNRADILGALAEYAASESALQLEIAKQYPDVHLSPGYDFDQGSDKWGVGLNVELPILNQNRGPIAEAEAHRRESAAKFNALQARVFGEIETALAGGDNARRRHATAAALLHQAQTQEQAMEKQFRAGAISRQSWAAASLERASAALLQLDALNKVQLAGATLENVLQSPLELPASLFIPSTDPASHHE